MSWLSALLGLDASHNAGVAQTQANQAQQEASGYRNQASGLYSGLTQQGQDLEQQGQTQYNQYSGLINSLLPQYEGAAGINGANNPGGTASPTSIGEATNAFALTPDEQQQLNSQIDTINQQHQAAQQAWQQAAAQRGFIDPSATAAQNEIIAQHFNQAANDHRAQFMENARQTRLNTLNNLLGFGANGQAGGVGQQEAGLGVQGGAAAGVAGLGAQAMENAGQQQNNANNLNTMANRQFGNFASLATYGLSKLFGGSGSGGSSNDSQTSGAGSDNGLTFSNGGYFNANGSPAIMGPQAPAARAPAPITPSYFLMGTPTGGDAYDNSMFDASGGF